MANQEQLDILFKHGVHVWNEWRIENAGVHIDLSDVSLYGINLGGVDLTSANLTGASLIDARLSGAE